MGHQDPSLVTYGWVGTSEPMARQPRIDFPAACQHVMSAALEMSTNQVANVLRRFEAEPCDK